VAVKIEAVSKRGSMDAPALGRGDGRRRCSPMRDG
jgi:hypothetical protein